MNDSKWTNVKNDVEHCRCRYRVSSLFWWWKTQKTKLDFSHISTQTTTTTILFFLIKTLLLENKWMMTFEWKYTCPSSSSSSSMTLADFYFDLDFFSLFFMCVDQHRTGFCKCKGSTNMNHFSQNISIIIIKCYMRIVNSFDVVWFFFSKKKYPSECVCVNIFW